MAPSIYSGYSNSGALAASISSTRGSEELVELLEEEDDDDEEVVLSESLPPDSLAPGDKGAGSSPPSISKRLGNGGGQNFGLVCQGFGCGSWNTKQSFDLFIAFLGRQVNVDCTLGAQEKPIPCLACIRWEAHITLRKDILRG